ncbi:anti-sigma factor [Paenibacillus sp. F411]|uniref:anti-sigma factor domain-containing protein n=1 Tax=Paenibacillus sp. F411 TaxID=2820239 RepID=UPI001AAE7A86|nr:anti-sigma factor [Paenibacillus sp. F411]MBO2944047.1 anti-sigma factor [Paenibacillus sp. F411]
MMDKHTTMVELVELYVLGGLSASEQKEFEAHLSECPECVKQVEEMKKVLDYLPLAAMPVQPPAGMKERILGHVLQGEAGTADASAVPNAAGQESVPAAGNGLNQPAESQATKRSSAAERASATESGTASAPPRAIFMRSSRGWRAASAGLAAAVIALGVYSAQLRGEVEQLELQSAEAEAAKQELLAAQNEADRLQAMLNDALKPSQGLKLGEAVKLDPVSEDIIAQGLATIVIDSQGTHLVVQAENLPELQSNEAFQVWLIKGEDKRNAGTFLARDGIGALYYTFEPEDYDTVAITVEPDAYGEQPRGRLILAAPIAGADI